MQIRKNVRFRKTLSQMKRLLNLSLRKGWVKKKAKAIKDGSECMISHL